MGRITVGLMVMAGLACLAEPVLASSPTSAPLALQLPNAQQQFVDSNGAPLAGGFVFTYIPGTTSPKLTWQDPNQLVPNSNPIILDANGQARIWGSGDYRQIVFDANSGLVWDQITRAQPVFEAEPPSWAGGGVWDSFRVPVNGYPLSSEYGNDTVMLAQAIVGAMDIPTSAVSPYFGSGVSGYSRTATANMAAVGVLGWGLLNHDGPGISTFGANFGVSNCPAPFCGTNGGFSLGVLYGVEIDVNNSLVTAGADPSDVIRGLYINADGVSGSVLSNAIDVSWVSPSSGHQWDKALNVCDGCAAIGASFGKVLTGNSQGSQIVNFKSTDSGGNDHVGLLAETANGDMVVGIGAANALFAITGSTGTPTYFSAQGTASAVNNLAVVAAGTGVAPRIGVAGADTDIGLTVAGKGSGAIDLASGLLMSALPAVGAGSGKHFVCVDSTTHVVYEGTGASCN